ncbi:MAG TPA: TetR family transcriptional regulator [Aldersonia sp.]
MRLAAHPDDLSTRARIRDAAVDVFAEQGFGVGVRAIAAAAGVSPGLVNHHFGSKDGLRVACDKRVLEIIRTHRSDLLRNFTPRNIVAELDEVADYAPLVAYILRSFAAGGDLARALFQHMVDDTERTLREGVDAGTLRPSRDPAARAHYLTLASLGAMLLHLQLSDNGDVRAALQELTDAVTLPAAELYTEGLLTDTTLLDTVIEGGAR